MRSLVAALLFSALSSIGAVDAAGDTPEQVHLGFAGCEGCYSVSWVSFNYPLGRKSQVEYWSAASSPRLGAVSSCESEPFVFTDRSLTTRTMHDCMLTDVYEAIDLRVRIQGGPWSDVFTFTPPPMAIGDRAEMRFAMFGDFGTNSVHHVRDELAARTQNGTLMFSIHIGDIAYNLDDENSTVGDLFMNNIQSVATLAPYMFGPGNHETDLAYSYMNYLNRYRSQMLVGAATGSNSSRYYSFDVGMAHFIILDTDAYIYPPVMDLLKPQYEWFEQDLQRVDRTVTPWLIVLGHRAMYCTKSEDRECNGEASAIRRGPLVTGFTMGLEQLLMDYGVDVYVSGHTHHYERTWPVCNKVVSSFDYLNPACPVHVQSGIAGVDGNDAFDVPEESWDAFRDETYTVGFGQIFLTETSFNFQQVSYDGRVVDEFTITRTL